MSMKNVELNLLSKIKKRLEEKSTVRVPFKTFIELWRPKNDLELTKQLIKFKIENELDYVVTINPIYGPQYIRFWDNSKKALEQGEDNALCETTKKEELKQDS